MNIQVTRQQYQRANVLANEGSSNVPMQPKDVDKVRPIERRGTAHWRRGERDTAPVVVLVRDPKRPRILWEYDRVARVIVGGPIER